MGVRHPPPQPSERQVKAITLINDTLSEWRTIRHAPDLAHQLFDRLDADEIERLALAGFAAEIRKALTKKHNGVPVYSNIDVIDKTTGKKAKRYKQTDAFTINDFERAVTSYRARATTHLTVAEALAKACAAKFGVQLPFTEKASA